LSLYFFILFFGCAWGTSKKWSTLNILPPGYSEQGKA